MPHHHPVSNPFGSGPTGHVGGAPEQQNPFHILSGGGGQSAQPSHATEAASPTPFARPPAEGQIPPPRQQPRPESNPFNVAGHEQPGGSPQPPHHGQGQPRAGGGFEMTGFPPGPAPMNQLDTAPLGGGEGGDRPKEGPAPSADPFAGMDLPQVSEAPAAPPEPEEEVVDYSAPEEVEEAPERPVEPERKAERRRPAAPQKKKSYVPIRPAASAVVTSETRQLELRAIFGVDHELSHQEIMQRARGLPGILQVAKASSKEAAALDTLQSCASKLDLDEDEPIVMSCSEGFIDFVSVGETTLAILRKDNYAPGVRETLIICARELNTF